MTSPGCKVLIVEDEPVVRLATLRCLGKAGFLCQTADNGRRALDLMARFSFDVVVTDLRMPEVNGHTLALEILSMRKRSVVVVLTAVTDPRLTADLLQRGVDHVEHKPADYPALVKKIRELAEARAATLAPPAAAPSAQVPPLPPALETMQADSVGSMLTSPLENLPAPPAGFDAFKDSQSVPDASELAQATHRDPSQATMALTLINTLYYNLTIKVQELERASAQAAQPARAEPQKEPLAVFVLGAICGWLLSWLGVGGWLLH